MAALPCCSIYDAGLLGDIVGNGGAASGGGGVLTGNGGTSSSGDGGGDGVAAGGMGGDDPGLGGAGDGDGDGDGGAAGGTTPGGGSGGSGVTEVLVDDLELGASYVNAPFAGTWARYDQTGVEDCSDAVWAAEKVADMIVVVEGDHVLRVEASDLDCWGIDVVVTLQGTDTIDITQYESLVFWGRWRSGDALLTVRLEDDISRDATCEPANCYKHAESTFKPSLTADWQRYEIPLSLFKRTPALDLTTAHAIHFAMDPVGGVADFEIDDISFTLAE